LLLIFSGFLGTGLAQHFAHASCDGVSCLFHVSLHVIASADLIEVSHLELDYAVVGLIAFLVEIAGVEPFLLSPVARAPPNLSNC